MSLPLKKFLNPALFPSDLNEDQLLETLLEMKDVTCTSKFVIPDEISGILH
jgi:hypothetical protein